VKPLLAAAATETADDCLVAAVREGSEEAFEALYRRYRPRIVSFVRSMCGDHARAEDIAQEAFMSALRGLRSSDKEIVFRPWLYEIARNACIDHMRRAGRSTEVSIDSDDFSPQEEGRVSQSVTGTDAEVARRKELASLQMAFGDLPESQHQILVMRELEGLSYDRIGSRMGLTRGAVESMLFRARRTVKDGFEDIDTGERCHRMHVTMETAAADHRLGMRDRRRLQVHLRQCADCRRTAVGLGLDDLALAGTERARSAMRRVAGFLPLPLFIRRRMGDAAGAVNSLGPAAEQGVSLAGKATAVVVAVAVAAGGAGVAHKASGGALRLPAGLGGEARQTDGAKAADEAAAGNGAGAQSGDQAAGAQGAGPSGAAGGADGTSSGGRAGDPGGGSGETGAGGDSATGGKGTIEGATGPVAGTVGGTTGTVGSLVGSPTETVDRTGKQVTGIVDETLQDATGGTAPRLPQVDLPGGDVSSPGTGGGTSTPSLPSTGDALSVPQVQVPGVNVPQPGVTVPGTGVRLP
jgi:RNA polymerase sigma factor (sigma-70 family)